MISNSNSKNKIIHWKIANSLLVFNKFQENPRNLIKE